MLAGHVIQCGSRAIIKSDVHSCISSGDGSVDFTSNKKTVMTRQGYEEAQQKLQELISVKRPALVNRIREARLLGDLRENFDYQDAKREQGMLEAKIKELEELLGNATVVDSCEGDGCINVGSKIVAKDLEEGFEDEYTIVGPAEASPVDGKVSYESALGAAFMGHKVGDTVEVNTPGGVFKYEIISVE
jgi:transcription elongation factor GreA